MQNVLSYYDVLYYPNPDYWQSYIDGLEQDGINSSAMDYCGLALSNMNVI